MNELNQIFLTALTGTTSIEIPPVIRKSDKPQFTEEELTYIRSLGRKEKKRAVNELRRQYALRPRDIDPKTQPVLGRDILNQK
jgi:hypothetical protein